MKKVLSGGPSGFDPMFLCDKGEFTHATIEGEAILKSCLQKKAAIEGWTILNCVYKKKQVSLSGLPSGTGAKNTFLYQTWKVSI